MKSHSTDLHVWADIRPIVRAMQVPVLNGPLLNAPGMNGPMPGLYRRVVKRLLDVILVLAAVPVVAPVILILALVVARDGHNPFYSQLRIGKDGRRFRMWKLRTMVPGADALLEGYLAENPEARREWETSQKLKHDPRITRAGHLLRATSLDELPQFLNVLNGTMSLVGPRPMLVDQQRHYSGRAYYALRPGISGMWQISDRNACAFADRARFDEAYDRDLSLRTDLVVLWRTLGVVLKRTGY